jgi:hypothetical protein
MARTTRKLKSVPTPKIETVIKGLDKNFLFCRSMGHNWAPYTVYKEGRLFESILHCSRCDGYRHQYITLAGKIAKCWYTYAAGYLIAGWGQMSADDRAKIRLAAIMMMMEEAAA